MVMYTASDIRILAFIEALFSSLATTQTKIQSNVLRFIVDMFNVANPEETKAFIESEVLKKCESVAGNIPHFRNCLAANCGEFVLHFNKQKNASERLLGGELVHWNRFQLLFFNRVKTIDVQIKAIEMEIANSNLNLENIELSNSEETPSTSINRGKGIYKF